MKQKLYYKGKKKGERKQVYLSKRRGPGPFLSDDFIKMSALGVDFFTAWKTLSPRT